jgi:predicted HTH transcriptional regulator
LEALIAEGEHAQLEFKESLRWDVRKGTVNKKLEDVAIKTVAALANYNGGTLLIGVSDYGEVVGIEPDIACLGGNRDKFELHLTNLLSARFSESFKATKIRVSFPQLAGKMICRIDVQRSREAIYVTLPDQSGAMAERLFVRSGNASHEIPPSQIAGFVREHFA